MRLLHVKDLTFRDSVGSNVPSYAIISHRWGDSELSYQSFLRDKGQYVSGHLESDGWRKISQAAELAAQCNLQWIWIDTICINKDSSAELTEAINSMYNWYKDATCCFVFLHDVQGDESSACKVSAPSSFTAEVDMTYFSTVYHAMDRLDPSRPFQPVAYTPVRMYKEEFVQSTWFKRSWTLQELLAPGSVIFFNSAFQPVGTRHKLASLINKATKIPLAYLQGDYGSRLDVTKACIAERMRWAAHRDATRTEDKAYSMLGLFEVNMPLLYGEGDRAFYRLQLEIIKEKNDETILAWDSQISTIPGLSSTASSPILSRSAKRFSQLRTARCTVFQRKHYETTNLGLRFTLPIRTNDEDEILSRMRVLEVLCLVRPWTFLLFPLNCYGTCKVAGGKVVHGLLALLVVIDNQLSHGNLKTLVGGRSRQLMISEDTVREVAFDADADLLMADSQNEQESISSRRWVSIATGERQSFDLVVDTRRGSTEDEYSLYLRLGNALWT